MYQYSATVFLLSGGWTPTMEDTEAQTAWIQADLSTVHLLISVTTQGRADTLIWTTSYNISYGNDVGSLTKIDVVYAGNTDQDTKVTNQLPCNTFGRYIRLHPLAPNAITLDFVGIRWDVIAVPDTQNEYSNASKYVRIRLVKI